MKSRSHFLINLVLCATIGTAILGCESTSNPSDGPTDPPPGIVIHIPDDAPSITAGLAISEPGDTILISTGTYFESEIELISDVVILGEDLDPTTVVIDGQGYGTILIGENLSEHTEISYITVTGGRDINGGGVNLQSSSPVFRHCVFRDNPSLGMGGAAHLVSSSPRFDGCEFRDNSATSGSALYLESSHPTFQECHFSADHWAEISAHENSSAKFSSCTFSDSFLSFSGGELEIASSLFFQTSPGFGTINILDGGNLDLLESSFENLFSTRNGAAVNAFEVGNIAIEDCYFDSNTTEDEGGAVWINNAVQVNITNSIFTRCESGDFGGALFCEFVGRLTIEDSFFEENTAGGGGGAIYVGACDDTEILDCTFSQNEGVGFSGGALRVTGFATENAPLAIARCEFRNSKAEGSGGAISLYKVEASIADCQYYNNEATAGGGAYFGYSEVSISESWFDGNIATLRSGGAIYGNHYSLGSENSVFFLNQSEDDGPITTGSAIGGEQGSDIELLSCTLSSNSSPSGGAAVFAGWSSTLSMSRTIISGSIGGKAVKLHSSSTHSMACSDIFGNEEGDWVDDIAGNLGVDGNFESDPIYCDPSTGDFHLSAESMCTPQNSPCGELVGAMPEGFP